MTASRALPRVDSAAQAALGPGDVLALQRAVGNHATGVLLRAGARPGAAGKLQRELTTDEESAIGTGVAGLDSKFGENDDPVGAEILKLAARRLPDDVASVGIHVRLMVMMDRNADALRNIVKAIAEPHRVDAMRKLAAELDKQPWTGRATLNVDTFQSFAKDPDELAGYARYVLGFVRDRWQKLTSEEKRVEFVQKFLSHEKGYDVTYFDVQLAQMGELVRLSAGAIVGEWLALKPNWDYFKQDAIKESTVKEFESAKKPVTIAGLIELRYDKATDREKRVFWSTLVSYLANKKPDDVDDLQEFVDAGMSEIKGQFARVKCGAAGEAAAYLANIYAIV